MVEEILEVSKGFTGTYYFFILLLLVIIGLIIYFIKKLQCNFSQILKSIRLSLLITAIIEIIGILPLTFLFNMTIQCSYGKCPTPLTLFIGFLPYTASIIFILTLLIYYIKYYISKNTKKLIRT